jgi:hypothetical protein
MPLKSLASRESVRVFYFQGQHIAIVIGKKPRHSEVSLREVKSHEGLNTFSIIASDPGQRNDLSDSYYMIKPILQPGPSLDRLAVLHLEGTDIVRVERLAPGIADDAPAVSGLVATGYSHNFNIDEAFQDAIAQLPLHNKPATSGEMNLVDVISMGAIYGGISGFSRLFVRVEHSCHTSYLGKSALRSDLKAEV